MNSLSYVDVDVYLCLQELLLCKSLLYTLNCFASCDDWTRNYTIDTMRAGDFDNT